MFAFSSEGLSPLDRTTEPTLILRPIQVQFTRIHEGNLDFPPRFGMMGSMTRLVALFTFGSTLLCASFASAIDSVTDLLDPGDGSPLMRVVVHQTDDPIGWIEASEKATTAGATLLAPSTTALNHQAANLAAQIGNWNCVGPWLGVQRTPSTDPIASGWTTSEQTPAATTEWASDAPAGAPRLPWYVAFDARTSLNGRWINTVGDPYFGNKVYGLVLAFSADAPDCDLDGFPDAFEIAFLDAPDKDADGVPDQCAAASADLNGDGSVDALDLAALLAAWGASSGPEDLDGDGIVGPQDLTYLLCLWTG